MSHPIALTIAGSDSGGGAGIQADLKTFSALRVYGASVITAITAQNTRAVAAVEAVSPAMIGAQLDAVPQRRAGEATQGGREGGAGRGHGRPAAGHPARPLRRAAAA